MLVRPARSSRRVWFYVELLKKLAIEKMKAMLRHGTALSNLNNTERGVESFYRVCFQRALLPNSGRLAALVKFT